jgi:hypothetical protein
LYQHQHGTSAQVCLVFAFYSAIYSL